MSTPIDQVRELIRYRGLRYEARDETRLTSALASVLRDAERYKALEARTWGSDHIIGMSRSKDDHMLVWGEGKTLAELADRLREGA